MFFLNVEVERYSVIIDGRKCFDHLITSGMRTYDHILKIATGQ